MRKAIVSLIAGTTLSACAAAQLPDPASAQSAAVKLLVEGPIEGVDDRYLVAGTVTLPPSAHVPRHLHDGEEFLIVNQGSVVLSWFADNAGSQRLSRELRAGEGMRIPPGTVHWAKAGEGGASATSSWIVVKGKPLRRTVVEPAELDR